MTDAQMRNLLKTGYGLDTSQKSVTVDVSILLAVMKVMLARGQRSGVMTTVYKESKQCGH